jgi:hypothetical protein
MKIRMKSLQSYQRREASRSRHHPASDLADRKSESYVRLICFPDYWNGAGIDMADATHADPTRSQEVVP